MNWTIPQRRKIIYTGNRLRGQQGEKTTRTRDYTKGGLHYIGRYYTGRDYVGRDFTGGLDHVPRPSARKRFSTNDYIASRRD